MARTGTKAASKASSTTKRTTKRAAAEQPKIYEVLEFPTSPADSKDGKTYRHPSELPSSSDAPSSPAITRRGRSTSTSSSTLHDDPDPTPTQSKPSRSHCPSMEPNKVSIPGLEALEAVNGLYETLKESQAEIQHLRGENEKLNAGAQACQKRIDGLQAELKTEKEKVRKTQQIQDKEAQVARKAAEEQLSTVLASLRSFRCAARGVMPLLDVLTGAADIEYDESTERLYQVLKQHKEGENNNAANNVKSEQRA